MKIKTTTITLSNSDMSALHEVMWDYAENLYQEIGHRLDESKMKAETCLGRWEARIRFERAVVSYFQENMDTGSAEKKFDSVNDLHRFVLGESLFEKVIDLID